MKPATDIIEKVKALILDAFAGGRRGSMKLRRSTTMRGEVRAAYRADVEKSGWVAIAI